MEIIINLFWLKYFLGLVQKLQKERQEKQEKEEEEKKEKQRQEAEEMIRRMHEGTDSLEERMAIVTDQSETKASGEESVTQVPEVVGETVEVDADASSSTNTDKVTAKTSTSTSSSEDVDEEALEGEEKIGKDGKIYCKTTK